WSSYFGGPGAPGTTNIAGLAVDPAGAVWLTGDTGALDFPTVDPIQPALGGSGPMRPPDAFVSRVAPDGSRLEFSTYYGGSGQDQGRAIALGPRGSVAIVGWTLSSDFPIRQPVQAQLAGFANPFVVKFDSIARQVVF